MKKTILAFALGALAVTSAQASEIKVQVGQAEEFSQPSKSFLKESPNIQASTLRLISDNQLKTSIVDAIGTPHFGTGIFPAKKWEYRFNVVNGDKVVEDCVYRIDFEKNVSQSIKANKAECVEILALNTQPTQVVKNITKVEKYNPRGIERAEAHFAFDKYTKDQIVNAVDWAKLAQEIKKDNPDRVYLSAHTDTVGKYLYNLELASKRADTIAEILIKHGVSPSVIEINNVGKTATFTERKVVISW